jgi:hypothetical protein
MLGCYLPTESVFLYIDFNAEHHQNDSLEMLFWSKEARVYIGIAMMFGWKEGNDRMGIIMRRFD